MFHKEHQHAEQETDSLSFWQRLLVVINTLKQLPMPRFRYQVVEKSLEDSNGFATKVESLPSALKPYAIGSLPALQQLYSVHVERSAIQTSMKRIGRLLSQRKGETVRERSKEVVNAHLSGNKVNQYEPILSRIVAETFTEWRGRQAAGESFDLRTQIDEMYTKLVSATLFGGKQPENFSEMSSLVSTYLTDMAGFTTAIILDEVMPDFLDFIKKPLQRTFVANIEQYPEFLKKEQELVTKLQGFLSAITPDTYDEYGMFGSYLKRADAGEFSREQVIQELIGMLFAALDTTSRATMFAVARLQENSKLFARLKQEVEKVFGEQHRQGTLELSKTDLNVLPELDAFVYATIAANPPVNIEIRETMEPVTITEALPSGAQLLLQEIKIPKGAMVFIHMQRALHHLSLDDSRSFGIDQLLKQGKSGELELIEEHIAAIRMAWAMGGDKYPCMGYKLSLFELKTFLIHLLLEVKEITSTGNLESDQAAVQIPVWVGGDGPQLEFEQQALGS